MKDFLQATFTRLISELNTKTYRYLYSSFNIDNRLTGVIGPRGVGKTTLLLQYIKNNLYQTKQVFYFSADNIYFSKTTILEFVAELYHTDGINIFFIDEIHKYKNWQQELKNLYDSFSNIKIVFSGNSSLDLITGSYDLSRRAVLFNLAGLSLREYINFTTQSSFSAISFSELISNYNTYDDSLAQIPKIKGLFNDYLKHGYYPFYFEGATTFYEKVLRVIDKTIFEDIANYYNLKTANLWYFKKLLNYLASIPPGELNIHNLAQNIGIDNKTINNYLHILASTGLVKLIYPYAMGNMLLRKAEKMMLNNTTLLYTLNTDLGIEISLGMIRELFFLQSLNNARIETFYNKIGDFRTKEHIFEIGGPNKKPKQIKNNQSTAIMVKDNILVSSKNVIPLYYFGFLY